MPCHAMACQHIVTLSTLFSAAQIRENKAIAAKLKAAVEKRERDECVKMAREDKPSPSRPVTVPVPVPPKKAAAPIRTPSAGPIRPPIETKPSQPPKVKLLPPFLLLSPSQCLSLYFLAAASIR